MSLTKLKSEVYDSQLTDFLVLGCGPSLNDFSEEELYNAGRGKIVIAIKQAVFKAPHADILCLNTCNMSDYSEVLKGGIHSIFQIAYPEVPYYDITNFDTILPITNVNNFTGSLSSRQNLDYWKFDNTERNFALRNLRCWGPGLLAETVFYLCHYFGAKNIYTIGVDGGAKGSLDRNHFYENQEVFNPAQPLEPKESEKEIELMDCFYDWLQSKGINWYIASENCYFSDKIPRIKF